MDTQEDDALNIQPPQSQTHTKKDKTHKHKHKKKDHRRGRLCSIMRIVKYGYSKFAYDSPGTVFLMKRKQYSKSNPKY